MENKNKIKKYYFQELPKEIQSELWEIALKEIKNEESVDDYINRNNFYMSIPEWYEMIYECE